MGIRLFTSVVIRFEAGEEKREESTREALRAAF